MKSAVYTLVFTGPWYLFGPNNMSESLPKFLLNSFMFYLQKLKHLNIQANIYIRRLNISIILSFFLQIESPEPRTTKYTLVLAQNSITMDNICIVNQNKQHIQYFVILDSEINTLWCIADTWAKSSNLLLCAHHHPGSSIQFWTFLVCKNIDFNHPALDWMQYKRYHNQFGGFVSHLFFDIGRSKHWLVVGGG